MLTICTERLSLIYCRMVFLNRPPDQFSDKLVVIFQIENFAVGRIIRKVWLVVNYYSTIIWALLKDCITRCSDV